MAKHEITVYQNTGATKETAPYIGSYISKETLRLDGFKAKISERCGLPAIQVQAILAGAFDAIEALEKESLVRVHLDGFTVCGIITGSFPTADAAFNKDKNALQMAVRLDEPIRNELAAIVPAIVTDSSVTRLRVDNVMDLEAPRPYNVIHGKHVFRVAGFNMVLSDEGAMEYGQITIGAPFSIAGADLGPDMEKTDEYVALLDGKGEVVAKAEISYSDLQNVKGVFEGVEVEAGEYTLAVFTRSGMGEEYGVKKATRKVTVM